MIFKLAVLSVILLFLLTVMFYLINKNFRVKKYLITGPNVPDELNIILLTDLHNNSFGKNNIRLVREIEKRNPDYIMISGDMIIGRKNFYSESTMHLLRELARRYEVFYAPGNHEQKLRFIPETKDFAYQEYINHIKEMGIHFLENETYKIEHENKKIYVTGLAIEREYFSKEWVKVKMNDDYIGSLVGERKKDGYHILLAHQPKYFEQYASWGADLVLSGHNHGGIVILPKLGGVISPSYKLFPKYDYGLFRESNSTMVLSKGLGLHTIKFRIGQFPELSVIQLKKSC